MQKLLAEWPVRKGFLETTPRFTSLFLDINTKKQEEDLAVDFMFDFIAIASKYLRPPMKDRCEGIECKMRLGQKLQLTFINKIPYLMCQNCIDTVDEIGKKDQEEYRKTPSNLLKGVIYGLGGMFAGALLWALIFIFFDMIGAAFAVFTFFIVLKMMDYVKTKRSFVSFFLASLLALCSSVLGTYLGMVGYLIKEKEIGINPEDLIFVARWLVEDFELLRTAIFFSLLGIVPLLVIVWAVQRRQLKSAFRPEVEVIPTFQVEA
jgi:hypothetical protein